MPWGFTLTEVIVVLGIIGTLASVMYFSLNGAHSKSRDTQRIKDLETLQAAVEQYYADNGTYPVLVSRASITTSSFAAAVQATLPTLPKDPSGSASYLYQSDATGASYCIVFTTPDSLGDFPASFADPMTPGAVYYGVGAYTSGC